MAKLSLPEEWVDDHADAMFRYALGRVRDESVVDDLLQETFLSALKARDTFRGESTLRTWLISILRRKIADHFRAKSKEQSRQSQHQQMEDESFRTDRLKAWQCDPGSTYERTEFWRVFHGCVGKLPPLLANAYMLREIDDCTTDEICELLDITSQNLALRIFRARCALRDCLEANWFAD